ncbi:MAG: ABC transporter substrate-binding protein [Moorea sp. SIO2I5]|nr:ABC transporter substrate-binding protein [Moorena sp. SIO2I5]
MLSWENPNDNLKTIAQAVNRQGKADKILQATKQKIKQAKDDLSSVVASHPQMLLLYAQGSQEFLMDNTRRGCSSLIKELGFELVSQPQSEETLSKARTPLSLEVIPQLDNADSIILFGYNFSNIKEVKDAQHLAEHQLAELQQEWSKNAIAQSMTASKQGRIYFISAYLCLGLTGSMGTELYLEELQEQLLSSN